MISYRLDVRVKPLFSVDVIIERKSATKIEFLIKAKSNFKAKSTANNVEVLVILNINRYSYQFQMMQNNLTSGQPMEQLSMLQRRKLCSGVSSNSGDRGNS